MKVNYVLKSILILMIIGVFCVESAVADQVEVLQRFYSGAGDGTIGRRDVDPYGLNESFSVITSSNGTNAYYESTNINIGSLFAGTEVGKFRTLNRGVIQCDLSAIPDDATVTNVEVNVYPFIYYAALGEPYIVVVNGDTSNDNSLVISDYEGMGNIALSELVAYSEFSALSDYVQLPFNSDGISQIDKTGFNAFYLTISWDLNKTYGGIAANGDSDLYSRVIVYSSEQEGTDKDPFIEITYICDSTEAPAVGGDVISVTTIETVATGPATNIVDDPIQYLGFNDISGNGKPEILVLGTDSSDNPIVCVIDASTGELVKEIAYTAGWTPKSMAKLPDLDFDTNTNAEISVLGVNTSTGDVRTEIRDSVESTTILHTVDLP